MADISLTDYLNFLNHFAESRKHFPFEKNNRVYGLSYTPALLLACFSGQAIGMGIRTFRMKTGTQKTGYFSGVKPVHAPVPDWAGNPFPGANWRFGHHHHTQIKVSTVGEKCHAIQTSPIQ